MTCFNHHRSVSADKTVIDKVGKNSNFKHIHKKTSVSVGNTNEEKSKTVKT